jgi:hypothetical protein
MRLISSIAFVLVTTIALAQHAAPRQPAAPKKDKAPVATATPEKDTVKVKKDPRRFIPTGVRVGTDGLTIARNFYDNTFSGWEVDADVDFDRYYFALEYGTWSRSFDGSGNVYDNDGRYFRTGIDVNFLTKDPEKNMFFFGLRYGHATYSEHLTVETDDPDFGEITDTYHNTNLRAHWYELTTGLRVKMIGGFWMGYTARFKFGLKNNDEKGQMITSDVPGFGRTDKPSTWGFNYMLLFRIPLGKAKVATVAAPTAEAGSTKEK